jgi:GPH family glycoside/pentoside/hexuronide:cation symporter
MTIKHQAVTLPLLDKICYGLTDFGSQFIYTTNTLFLVYFLTDVALVGPTLVGVILLVTRIWDAVIDPFLGYVSDHTRTRWGQKRPYLLFTAIPLGLTLLLVYYVPPLAESGKFIYYFTSDVNSKSC